MARNDLDFSAGVLDTIQQNTGGMPTAFLLVYCSIDPDGQEHIGCLHGIDQSLTLAYGMANRLVRYVEASMEEW